MPFLTLRGGATAYLHPNLIVGVDTVKGRQVIASKTISEGDVMIVDTPYALVPAMERDEPPFFLCSNSDCNRRVSRTDDTRIHCPNDCTAEVSWCSQQCCSSDSKRHAMECSWLKALSVPIRTLHGDSDFGMLWLIARIIIAKYVAGENATSDSTNAMSEDHFNRNGWDAVWNLEGDVHAFPEERITYWTHLAEVYLLSSLLGARLTTAETVNLICKIELNSFGLYPGVTGEYPVESFVSRGEYYGGGIYPTAAMFNHACCPNVRVKRAIAYRSPSFSPFFCCLPSLARSLTGSMSSAEGSSKLTGTFSQEKNVAYHTSTSWS